MKEFSSLKGKCVPYRKPVQTDKVILSNHNTPTEPFQSLSTNIHVISDSAMILWIQNNRKWFCHGKLLPIIGLLRKCFIQMKSLPTLHVVPVISWFVWPVRLINTGLVLKNDFTKAFRNASFDFATPPRVPFSKKQLLSTELNN